MKRFVDIFFSMAGLLLCLPVLCVAGLAVWLQDFHSPFYIALRTGRYGRQFRFFKLRSMILHADRNGISSTSSSDPRITRVGRFIRKFKLDELPQLWNVLRGDMSFVGPRPNVKAETDLYTSTEDRLLAVRPGLTDLASIVFSDEGEILKNTPDAVSGYNQLIRPWKSRLGLLYIAHASLLLDIQILFLTAIVVISRRTALRGVERILRNLNADAELIRAAKRTEPLRPHPPPGATETVTAPAVDPARFRSNSGPSEACCPHS